MWIIYPVGVFYNTRWLTEFWSAQAKVEGNMSMTAWLWGRDSSVFNNPLGVLVRTPLYVVFPSTWVSLDGELMYFPIMLKGSCFGENRKVIFYGNHVFCRRAPSPTTLFSTFFDIFCLLFYLQHNITSPATFIHQTHALCLYSPVISSKQFFFLGPLQM